MRLAKIISWGIGAGIMVLPVAASAHCDGLDGPVVSAARSALESGNPDPVLIWVQPKDEGEVRAAFEDAVNVRKFGPQAQSLADRYFFETIVRLHRAGEGAPYTGLKPAGRDLGPAIPLADKAVATGSERELETYLARQVEEGVQAQFAAVQRNRKFRPDDLAAGRRYVASYVAFIHFVERLHEAARTAANGHFAEGERAPDAHQE